MVLLLSRDNGAVADAVPLLAGRLIHTHAEAKDALRTAKTNGKVGITTHQALEAY